MMTPSFPVLSAVLLTLLGPLAALLTGFFYFHRFRPDRTHWPMLASCACVLAGSLTLAGAVYSSGAQASWDFNLFQWMWGGAFSFGFGFRIDSLSAYVLAMVSIVGGLIHCYAVGYMRKDPGFSRFFLYFHFFFFSMIGLLLSNNYLQMYLFWEGVGVASFLLIGFWSDKASARAAAWKAFLTNRIGDLGFMMAVLLMASKFGTVRFTELFPMLGQSASLVPTLGFLLFWGACAKSAQFPLYGWLPDAMEGPTPVSALMHAATMVAAGVFLMLRSWPILQVAPGVLRLIAWVGASTAVGAAVFASMKTDLKKILAYSTVSQLGLMMLSIGMGEVAGAEFHLITHGFFKALLFLCAGNVIHGLPGHRSTVGVSDAGGLSSRMPVTYGVFLAGALALSGIFPFSGFFSKDMILASVFEGPSWGLKGMALLIAVGSGFYIFRMMFLVFHGERPEQSRDAQEAHEAGPWMTIPLFPLVLFTLLLSLAGPKLHPLSWGIALGATLLAGVGIGLAYAATMVASSWDWRWRAAWPGLERSLDADLGWQALSYLPARGAAKLASVLAWKWDLRIWDAWTETVADCCVGLSEGLSGISRGWINDYIWWMLAGTTFAACFIVLCY